MPRIHDHENEITYFARTNFRGHDRKFGIKTDDRRRHMYVIGKTGMGKTTLIENMVLQDVYNGHGVCYIDPHGDTVEKILNYLPSWRVNDVMYFNPADLDHPIGFNVLEAIDDTQKHLVAAGMMGVFKKIWEGMWSARMEYILNNTILALLDTPETTLLAVNRMYSDEDFRKQIVSNVKDPVVKAFWVLEYAGYSEKFATEAVAAIQNKIGQFITSGLIRNIIGQVRSTMNIREMMDTKKIMLVNLSKGRIGEDNMRLLGGMLITKVQLAAMARVDMPEEKRQDFYLYVDEFQNFATESFASILSEARKYRLSLIVAHQYIAQLTEEVRDAVLGNVGTLILFRVGAPDGVVLEPELAPRFMVEDIINLPKFQVYLKLMIDGVASSPFSAATLPPIARVTNSEEKVIRISRERYGRNREEIEDKIMKWTGLGEDADIDALMEKAKAKGTGNPPKKKFDYKCSWCAKDMKIPVKLDRSRPIYCEDCRDKMSDLRRTGDYDARKDLIYDEELNVVGSVAELGSDGSWLKKKEAKEKMDDENGGESDVTPNPESKKKVDKESPKPVETTKVSERAKKESVPVVSTSGEKPVKTEGQAKKVDDTLKTEGGKPLEVPKLDDADPVEEISLLDVKEEVKKREKSENERRNDRPKRKRRPSRRDEGGHSRREKIGGNQNKTDDRKSQSSSQSGRSASQSQKRRAPVSTRPNVDDARGTPLKPGSPVQFDDEK